MAKNDTDHPVESKEGDMGNDLKSCDYPRCSMHSIFTYIWSLFMVNEGTVYPPYIKCLGIPKRAPKDDQL